MRAFTVEQIKSGNIIMANAIMKLNLYDDTDDIAVILDLGYHDDWNKLMIVKDFIENLPDDPFHGKFGVHIYSNSCTIQATRLCTDPDNLCLAYLSDVNAVFHTCMESAWYNMVEFIKWYNRDILKL